MGKVGYFLDRLVAYLGYAGAAMGCVSVVAMVFITPLRPRCLQFLYHRKHKLGLNDGLNVWDIHLQSGVDYDYLRSRLRKWKEWGYLNRKPVDTGVGRPEYQYTIAKRGEHFIEDIVPRNILNQYIAEIKAKRLQ